MASPLKDRPRELSIAATILVIVLLTLTMTYLVIVKFKSLLPHCVLTS